MDRARRRGHRAVVSVDEEVRVIPLHINDFISYSYRMLVASDRC